MVDRLVTADRLVQVKGSELLWPLLNRGSAAALAAEAASTAAEQSEVLASQYAAAAAAFANRFPTYAAGNAATPTGQDFTVVSSDGKWINVFRKGTSTEATPLIQLPGKAAYEGPEGAALIGYRFGEDGAFRSLLDKLGEQRSVNDFASGDPDDWTDAINAASLDAAKAGGGELIFGARDGAYPVHGTVIIPSFVRVNLNGQLLSGTSSLVGTMFATGRLVGGELVSNLDSAPEQDVVYAAALYNGRIENVDRGVHFRNFIRGGRVQDIMFENVRRPVMLERCFYALVDNISMAGGSDPAHPSVELYDQNNAMVIRRVSAITEWGMLVHGGAAALTIDTPSFEGGSKGLVLRDDIIGASVRNGYFEAISGPAIDSSAPGTRWVHYEANYLNIVDDGYADGGSDGEATHFGEWGASNRLNQANVGSMLPQLPGYTFRGRMQMSGKRQYMTVDPGASQTDLSHVVAPANWEFGAESVVRSLKLYSGDGTAVNARAAMWSGVVPLVLRGDCGAQYEGPGHSVPFCDVNLPTGASVTATITTRLTFRPATLFAKYQLTINDNRGARRAYGDVFGADVDPRDRSDLTVTAVGVNIGGTTYTQLRVAGINNMNGAVAVRGIVRMVG